MDGEDLKAGRKEWFQVQRLRVLVKGHSFSEALKKGVGTVISFKKQEGDRSAAFQLSGFHVLFPGCL